MSVQRPRFKICCAVLRLPVSLYWSCLQRCPNWWRFVTASLCFGGDSLPAKSNTTRLPKSGSYRSHAANPSRASVLRFAISTKGAHMLKEDRPNKTQPVEDRPDAVGTAESRAARFTFVQRVLREAGIGIALLL